MSKALKLQKKILIFGVPALIIGVMLMLVNTTIFQVNPTIFAIGITIDLLFILPMVYFLLIRKTTIPKTTVVPILILGVICCSLILPSDNQQYLNIFKSWALPLIELLVISYVIYNFRNVVKIHQQTKEFSLDFFTNMKITCYKILPKKVVFPVVTEISVFYYGFIYWKKRVLKENEFSYHKNSGTITLLIAIIIIVAVETVTLHLLLLKWSAIAAWILTFLSVYSGIQIFGFLKSMLKRPILIENNRLYLRYGIMSESIINLHNIDQIDISSKETEFNKETRKLSFLGDLESHNIVISLNEKETVVGLYGIKKKYKDLVFYVDDKNEFKNRINLGINEYKRCSINC